MITDEVAKRFWSPPNMNPDSLEQLINSITSSTLTVIDGNHRVQVWKELGVREINAMLVVCNDINNNQITQLQLKQMMQGRNHLQHTASRQCMLPGTTVV